MTEAQKVAHDFLTELNAYLNSGTPAPAVIRSEIAAAVQDAKALPKRDPGRRAAFPEGAFLNNYVLPRIHEFLRSRLGLTVAEAKRALLSESYRAQPELILRFTSALR